MRNFKFSLTLLPLALTATAQAQISGAGATFPELLYNNWAKEYKASGGAAVNYQGIGSGGGIKAITAKTVDFGASDSPMNAEERQGRDEEEPPADRRLPFDRLCDDLGD